jgi:hypothetical protein
MLPVNSRITGVGAMSNAFRLYHPSRRIGEAVTIDNNTLYVSQSSTESGRVLASLGDAARWLEAIEIPVALLSSAPDPGNREISAVRNRRGLR